MSVEYSCDNCGRRLPGLWALNVGWQPPEDWLSFYAMVPVPQGAALGTGGPIPPILSEMRACSDDCVDAWDTIHGPIIDDPESALREAFGPSQS